MKLTKWLSVIAAIAMLGWFSIQALRYMDGRKDPARAAFILNLPQLPLSARNVVCSGNAITDLSVTCAFEINPTDFDHLLAGWQFDKRNATGKSARFAVDASVGAKFDVAVEYSVQPPSFKHGGRVNLVTNQNRSLVLANRFEE